MKSTKALEVPNVGCVVQVTTQQGDSVAEALTFIPGVEIVDDDNGGRKLAPL
jgi:nitrate reductase NapAB chaperone NapD